MRIAVCGSHGTGKSTLIAAFVARRPEYVYEPEAFETLGDDVDVVAPEGPTSEGLHALLEHSVGVVERHGPGARVVHERSPVDYLAYAAASRRTWSKDDRSRFVRDHVPLVRACLRHLDLIALLPLSGKGPIAPRAGESAGFRRRVAERLGRALIDDVYELFGEPWSPRVVELSPVPERRLPELMRLTRMQATTPR
jgi:hypothetical protein